MSRPDPGPSQETLADWLGSRGEELSEQYVSAAKGNVPTLHCPTGLRRLDDAGLLELGVCTVVLGHEGDGKSALGLQFLEGCAVAGYDCQAYWPEDPRRFIVDRVLSPRLGESASKLRRLKIEGVDVPERIKAAVRECEEWAKRVVVDDRRLESHNLIKTIEARITPNTRLVLVDYAQVLTSEQDEKSVERVITRVVWELNEIAKKHNITVVLLSQVRTTVKERGRATFDRWRYKNNGEITTDAVEGYRPLAGDGQWAPGALGQKARAVLSWFRPSQWMKMHGADVKDDRGELLILKSNYGPAMETLTLAWNGPTTRITDLRK
jgi:replicative DNA helicase